MFRSSTFQAFDCPPPSPPPFHIFTKVCRPLVKLSRLHGIKIVLYLDDGISTANSHKQCFKNSVFVKSSLPKAGFLPNEEKSIWNPTQVCEWSGTIFNAIDFYLYLSLPQERISSLIYLIDEVLKSFPLSTARALAKLQGR